MRSHFPSSDKDQQWRMSVGNFYGGNPLTAVLPSVFFEILEEVQTAIRNLSLDQMASVNIEVGKVNPERETVFPGLPGILIIPLGEEGIPVDGGTLRRDDIGYPVGILMMDQERQQSGTGLPADADEGTQDQDYNLNAKLLWREKIRKEFISQGLSAVTSANVWNCIVEPQLIVDPTDFLGSNIWLSTLVLRFLARETRGN